MRLAPEPMCNKTGFSSGTSSPIKRDESVGEEELLAVQDLVAWQATLEAVVRITPAVLPTGTGIRISHVSGAPPPAYGREGVSSCTKEWQNGKEESSDIAFPAASEQDAEHASGTGDFSTVGSSLECPCDAAAVAECRIPKSCAPATCWQGFMVSRGLVLGCTFAVVAIIEVLFQVLKEALTGEESLEDTLARGTLRKTTLESITEEEEESEEECEGEELTVSGCTSPPQRHSEIQA